MRTGAGDLLVAKSSELHLNHINIRQILLAKIEGKASYKFERRGDCRCGEFLRSGVAVYCMLFLLFLLSSCPV